MPDPLDASRVRDFLRGRYAGDISCIAEAGSTNDLAAEAGRAGAGDGWAVFAERQTRGRGRRGRVWETAPGESLALSVLFRPALGLRDWPRLTTMAGVAVADAAEMVSGCRAEIKWPNDVLVGGKKLAGILAETSAGENPFAVVGIGINVAQTRFAGPLEASATSLRIATGKTPDRHLVAAAILDRLAWWRERIETGFAEIVAAARERSCLIGRAVTLSGAGEESVAVVAGLNAEGALIVRDLSGRERVIASGEVSVRL